MSKKNRSSWQKSQHAPAVGRASSPALLALAADLPVAPVVDPSPVDFSPISPAQLAANRANALLSTGPRTSAGKAASSRNAVKSALTGRTVLLPTDDVEEYAAFLAGFQRDLAPVGQAECELVQTIVDCFWRLRRVQALEFALYAHGHEQFENAFSGAPEEERYSKILLQTHLTYEKQFRNYQIQEARLDRKRSKAMAEFELLQAQRKSSDEPSHEQLSDAQLFAAMDAGFIPPGIAARLSATNPIDRNGFDFSNSRLPVAPGEIAQLDHSVQEESKAA